jgi:type I restriction enzyme S subunit
MSFPRYERYKDSEVEWLGEVPEHWDVIPLKRLADFINGDAFKPTEWAESGVPIIRIQNLNGGEEFNYYEGEVEPRYLVHDGDLLFGWSGNRGTSFGPFLWRRKEVCALNQHIFRVVPATLPKQALYWTLKAVTAHVEDQAHGIIGMVHITKGDLGAINVPIPPEEEHRTLATFLDRETAKIDALVEEQRRLIELLKEKRQAVISHAVTKGLDPDVQMKDSSIDWVGDVPHHWTVVPVAYRYDVQLGKMLDTLKITGENLRPYLRVVDVQWDSINVDDLPMMDFDEDARCKFRLRAGDLLINEGGSYPGRTAIWSSDFECYYQKALHRLRPRAADTDHPRYFFYLMFWALHTGVFTAGGNEATIEHLPAEKLRRYRFAFPRYEEQSGIAEFLDEHTSQFNSLIRAAQRAVELFQERRSALISAAVTGKIDVRNYAPKEAA